MILDIRGSSLKDYPMDLFEGLVHLKLIYAHEFPLCCKGVLPTNFNSDHCHFLADELSSCENMLDALSYRLVFWCIALLSLAGNVSQCIGMMVRGDGLQACSRLRFFYLCVAKCLSGLSALIVSAANEMYRGEYVCHQRAWQSSATCKVVGVVSLFSSQLSALLICFITQHRYL
jgi:hypothetical protein